MTKTGPQTDTNMFRVESPWPPAGDQPVAIDRLAGGLRDGHRYQTLLGITGSGKSFTVASVIARHGRPALVLAPNKSLAAQLFTELRSFLPHNKVEYFVSYYDYYQPEAYVPSSDTYIEKSSVVNDEIDRLRHSATSALLTRSDTVVVASVSAIYGLGDPDEYRKNLTFVRRGETVSRDQLVRRLVERRYERNDTELTRGRLRVRGDVVDVIPSWSDDVVRIEFFGDDIESITVRDRLGTRVAHVDEVVLPPASHYASDHGRLVDACRRIEDELDRRLVEFQDAGKLVEAQRLGTRVRQDVEMLRETGWCSGVENYSAPIEGRGAGVRPHTLLDYFPDGFVVVMDESHVTVPQLRGAWAGDRSRKQMLVDHGFRLPSALDNRPLRFEEILDVVDERKAQVVFVSATPAEFELDASAQVVEQIVRPTGLLDPTVEVRPATGQVADLLGEIRKTTAAGGRTLVTTLTKRMAEELTIWLGEQQVKVRHLHSDVDTLERIDLLRDLRLGTFDVLVGINLLREGLDLPEVQLVAVLDADKEGFLRSRTSLLQTAGRAARNAAGKVLLYADKMTPSMQATIDETHRRREAQQRHNSEHGIVPVTVSKPVVDILAAVGVSRDRKAGKRTTNTSRHTVGVELGDLVELMDVGDADRLAAELERRMLQAAQELRFEEAAMLRDMLNDVRPQPDR